MVPQLRLENSVVDDCYEVDRCLSRGSYAEIFLAFDNLDRAAVIIKALNTSLQGTPDLELERTLVENFQNEAIALDKVRHPHIIRRLGHGTAADLAGVPFHYLVLEYMPGGDLLSLSRRRPLTLEQSLLYFRQVAEALAYAHGQRVIHRDIKPNNLLLSADERIVKIADFGVAKVVLEDSNEITRVGTNVYAPPEHHPDSPSGALDERLTPTADVYSLAKTIYTVMSGVAPRGFSRQPITALPPEMTAQPWGAELLTVLRKATQTRVAERHQSVEEFWEEFVRIETSGSGDGGFPDPEATIVRSRLGPQNGLPVGAERPDFQALVSQPGQTTMPRKARIVVDVGPVAGHPVGQTHIGLKDEAPAVKSSAVANSEPGNMRVGRVSTEGRSFFDRLRAIIASEWLRRAFVVFLIAALIGLVWQVYSYFSGARGLEIISQLQNREAVIGGAMAVNLRSEPWGSVLAELPAGTRVRVVENRGGWTRVKVIRWPAAAPENAADGGWVDGQFVRLE